MKIPVVGVPDVVAPPAGHKTCAICGEKCGGTPPTSRAAFRCTNPICASLVCEVCAAGATSKLCPRCGGAMIEA